MKKKILVKSFAKGNNQGCDQVWGIADLETKKEMFPAICRSGCESEEIHSPVEVEWVVVGCRAWVVTAFRNHFGAYNAYEKKGVKYEITIPYEVAQTLFTPPVPPKPLTKNDQYFLADVLGIILEDSDLRNGFIACADVSTKELREVQDKLKKLLAFNPDANKLGS